MISFNGDEMKQNPKLKLIQENMQPGAFTAHGFLGNDSRALKDILRTDENAVAKMGLTHKDIATRMRYFTEVGKEAPDSVVIMDGIFEVLVDDHRGFIPCPFADYAHELKSNTKLINRELDREIYWSDLNIHMIEEHGFYEGEGSFFRTDPVDLAKILGLFE